jgi:urea transporter
LTAWLLLFAVYHFGQLHSTDLIGPMPAQPVAAIQTTPFVLTTWVFVLPTAGVRALQRGSVAEVRPPS